jgi:MFS family permease
MFVCIFAFANFETTLSLLLKGERVTSAFHFDFQQVCLVYAFIGLVLTFAQGVLVRRLSGKLSEGVMASGGAIVEIIGFSLLIRAIHISSLKLLLAALAVVVVGFAFMMPSLNSLISRRSDPAQQGSILGVGQSISSLARILGPAVGVPLLMLQTTLPYMAAAGLMALGLLLVIGAARSGRDYTAT